MQQNAIRRVWRLRLLHTREEIQYVFTWQWLRQIGPEARSCASAAKILAALQAILPYAEAEAEALQDLRYGDEFAGEQADKASSVVEQAQALIAGDQRNGGMTATCECARAHQASVRRFR